MNNSALLELSRKLSFDVEGIVIDDVDLALENPLAYFEKYKDRLDERCINEPIEELAWISLVDVLLEHQLAFEIDWKETGLYVCDVVDELLGRKKLASIDWEEFESDHYSEMPTDEFLNHVAKKLREAAVSLAYIDINSDSYVLITVPAADIEEIKRLAEKAEVVISDFF
ncbi:hypothetical protein AV654_25295 [Paenibacillus elgii]|uniref:DUF6630 domain-containing protein n=1 Tax=Paenibacillus elgii TaxID=189691 RepID=A0A161RWJ5_9BACL|nr:DUF6630 family protein [Paenibacillus elgii]KZE75789.1 hypothetical protein AV654_25295 [Paenibacillus elgii]